MKRIAALLLCIVLMLTLTACGPVMIHLDKSELENKVVKVELIHYENPKQKLFKSWVPDHSKKLKPFEEARVVVLEELPTERMSGFLDQLSETGIWDKFWAVDSPRCFCLRLTCDDGSFLILNCYGHSYGGYIGTYSSDGEVQDFIGSFCEWNGFRELVENFFSIELESE